MKWTFALCLLSSAATCAALPLINSSFEEPAAPPDSYADITPDDWIGIEPDDTFQISVRGSLRRTGAQSVAFNAAGTPPGASISQAFASTPGTGYEVSFWTTANIPSRSSVRAEAWDGDDLIAAADSNLAGNSFSFSETRFRFVAKSELTTITIVDTSSDTALSDLFLDDVNVTELPLPVTLGYWRFEEGVDGAGATSVVDSSGNGHEGTPTGNLLYRDSVAVDTIEQTGESNRRSLEFDGTNSVVAIAHAPEIDPVASFTIEFWMRSSGTGAGQDLLIDKSHGFGDSTGWVFQSQPGTGVILFGLGNGSGFPGVTSNADLFDDRWHHLAGTYDGSAVELFVDGVSQGSTTVGTYQSNTRDIRMGNTWQQSRFFAGQLDEVRLSEGVRLPAQLLYSPPVLPPDPAIRLTFDPGNEFLPEWDPRGSLIAFSTDRQPGDWRDIGGVEADGSDERLLATGIQSPFGLGNGPFCWLGDSGNLLVHDTVGTHEYLEFDVSMAPFNRTASDGDDAAFTRKLFIGGGGGGGEFRVSLDGSTALWRHSSSGGGGQTTIRTAPYSSLTGQSATVGTVHIDENQGATGIYYQGMAISPDGTWFVIARPASTGLDLWRFQTDGSIAPIQLTTSGLDSGAWNRLPDIAPDGETIAYSFWTGVTGETNDIFLMAPDGSNPRNVTNTPIISEANVTFSPDGMWIAYQRSDPVGSPGLMPGETPSSNIFKLSLAPPTNDTDGDGLVDFLEAALLTDPNTPDVEKAPRQVTIDEDGTVYSGLRFRREPGGATDVSNVYTSTGFTYLIELSTDMLGWNPAGQDIVLLSPVDNGDGSESVVARLAASQATVGERLFIRLRVTAN